jgi:hypothetical protein
VKQPALIDTGFAVGGAQEADQVGTLGAFDSDHIGAQRTQPTGGVRHREDPSEIRDPDSC